MPCKDFTSFVMLVVLTALMAVQVAVAVPTPVAEYLFEESGVTAVNTGSLGAAANLTMGTSLADPTDRHSPSGDGVWPITPRALDHRFGDTSVAARAISSGSVSALDNLTAVTITGWYLSERVDRLPGNERQMVANGGDGTGFRVEGGESGPNQDTLRFKVNSSAVVSGAGTYPDPGSAKYTFFAITFDGSLGSNNVRFYRGYTDAASGLVATETIAEINTGDTGDSLAVGGRSSYNAGRTFHGLMDDVRIFSSALSAADIESVRLSSLPEPTGVVTMLALGSAVAMRRRSHRIH